MHKMLFCGIIFLTSLISCKKEIIVTSVAEQDEVFIDITKKKADSLISINGLIKGRFYKIRGVHPSLYDDGTSSGSTIILQAIEKNKFSLEGSGIFYNPKYNKAVEGYGVWSNRSTWNATAGTGTFNSNELITANNGATGQLFATIESNVFIALTGDWSTATNITGNVTGATATITGVSVKSYGVGSKTIWGGYSWTNVNGKVGAKINILALNSEWKKDSYDTINYNIAVDVIEYDYLQDWIIRRYEVSGANDVVWTKEDNIAFNMHTNFHGDISASAISVFMYGNSFVGSTYYGVGSNNIFHSYFECVDFSGDFLYDNTLSGVSFIYNNTLSAGSALNNNIFTTRSGFYGNTFNRNGAFSGNTVTTASKIFNNTFTNNSIILNNTLNSGSSINDNTFSNNGGPIGSIVHNTLNSGSNITGNVFRDSSGMHNNTINNSSFIKNNIFVGSQINTNVFNNLSSIEIGLATTITSKYIHFLTAESGSINVNINLATILPGIYPKTLFKRSDGVSKLRYYNNLGALVIADVAD